MPGMCTFLGMVQADVVQMNLDFAVKLWLVVFEILVPTRLHRLEKLVYVLPCDS